MIAIQTRSMMQVTDKIHSKIVFGLSKIDVPQFWFYGSGISNWDTLRQINALKYYPK